ncbi:YbgC/FadM family acyl-CoA thioesterase [Novosphingobium piscinae]|uniref:YbgC/FadM family acyl-CoA thioesterase n=1 Tax=Novosphingobium piscinae TaxID=1507448 RepID=A0A7X1KRH1_9SPHN|nr:YbgC/FadM family acyl-CoA thioesterase [Novosphingobium piscinae]MBC2670752.1 YbgC/FadM family acyl-CoA thioesterase [Novosphingobium piscinae]
MTVPPNPPMPRPAEGRLDGPLHRFALRAHFEDTDLSGVVYHANYLRWFERARSDLLRQLGIDQRAAHEAGEGAYAVSDLQIRYLAPARLDDDVLIETAAEELGAASSRLVQRAYRLAAGDGPAVLLSDMRVRVGFLGPDGRPRRQPAAWRSAFASFQSATPET